MRRGGAGSHEERESDVARGPVREELRCGAAWRAAHKDETHTRNGRQVEYDAEEVRTERHEEALRENAQQWRLPLAERGARLIFVDRGCHA